MENWPPDYKAVYAERIARLNKLMKDPVLQAGARQYYADPKSCAQWISDWVFTYDPRNASGETPSTLPFIPFAKQVEAVEFLFDCLNNETDGLAEKSRDMGFTWLCCAVSVYLWLYTDGVSIGWGSRKEALVDRLGDMDSIFEKMRFIIEKLPSFMLPDNWSSHHMKLVNNDNGSSITGEAGDNIGRGGRKSIFFKDESSHYERPEKIEAALGDNTRVQIDISSVNGTNNVFYRRRMAGQVWAPGATIDPHKTQVFIMDWSDHPAKTQEWYDRRRAKAEADGLLHIFAQEVDRDYAAAVEGVLIPPAWVKASIDADKKLGIKPSGRKFGGLDVADEGGDKNALAVRQGFALQHISEWGEGDTGQTARRATSTARLFGVTHLGYDSIGVGAGVKSEINRLRTDGVITDAMEITPWNAGSKVLYPNRRVVDGDRDTPRNEDFFKNLKAQASWELRRRFEKTYRAVTMGAEYDPDELISLDGKMPLIRQLEAELSQPTYGPDTSGKIVINKKPNGASSPNLADAVVMAYFPILKPAFYA